MWWKFIRKRNLELNSKFRTRNAHQKKGKLSFRHMTVENKKITSLDFLKFKIFYSSAASRNIQFHTQFILRNLNRDKQTETSGLCSGPSPKNGWRNATQLFRFKRWNERELCNIIVYCLVSAVVSHFNNVWQHEKTHFSVAIVSAESFLCEWMWVDALVGCRVRVRISRCHFYRFYREIHFLFVLSFWCVWPHLIRSNDCVAVSRRRRTTIDA